MFPTGGPEARPTPGLSQRPRERLPTEAPLLGAPGPALHSSHSGRFPATRGVSYACFRSEVAWGETPKRKGKNKNEIALGAGDRLSQEWGKSLKGAFERRTGENRSIQRSPKLIRTRS